MMWYYQQVGQQKGPVDDAVLTAFVRQGVLLPSTPVWREGMAQWLPLNETELAAYAPRITSRSPMPGKSGTGILWVPFFVLLYIASGLSIIGFAIPNTSTLTDFLRPVLIFFGGWVSMAAGLVGLLFLSRVWALIQGSGARTTPGRAAGFFFIPLFNAYWPVVAILGLAHDLNRYCEERFIPGKRVNESLALAFYIVWLAGVFFLSIAYLKDWAFILPAIPILAGAVATFFLFRSFAGCASAIIAFQLTSGEHRPRARLLKKTEIFLIIVTLIVAGIALFAYTSATGLWDPKARYPM